MRAMPASDLTRYRNGDRDHAARAAAAKAKRGERARNPNAATSAAGVKSKVVAMPTQPQPVEARSGNPEPGEVETAVREQCEASKRSADQAGIVAAAIKLARLIDDDDFGAQAGQNIAKLQKLLAELKPQKRKINNHHLTTVSRMAGRGRTAI